MRDEVLGFLDDLVAKYAQASQVDLQLPAGSVFAQHGLKELRPATVAPTGTAFDDVMGVIVAGVPGGIVRLWRWRVAPGGPETLALVVHEGGKPVLALAPVLAGGQPRLHVVASDREAGRVEVGRLSVDWRADGVVDRVVPGGPATEAGRVHVQVGLAHTIDLDPVLGTGPLRGELWVDVRAGTGAGGFGWRAGATFGPLEVDLGRITGLPIPVAAGTGPLGVVATPRLEVYAGRFGLRADIEPVKVDLQFSPAGATGVLPASSSAGAGRSSCRSRASTGIRSPAASRGGSAASIPRCRSSHRTAYRLPHLRVLGFNPRSSPREVDLAPPSRGRWSHDERRR